MSRYAQIAAKLGLVVNDGPRTIDLQDDVKLVMRPPDGLDWSMAGARVAEVMTADQKAGEGRTRYRLTSAKDKAGLADPKTWNGVAELCVAAELAALVVTSVTRQIGDERRSVEVDVGDFADLFRLGDNLDRFIAEARKASRELVTAKKE